LEIYQTKVINKVIRILEKEVAVLWTPYGGEREGYWMLDSGYSTLNEKLEIQISNVQNIIPNKLGS